MVWLHGGGLSTGSGSAPIIDGTNLAHTYDVVVVSINHRLNVFGFTYLGELAGSDFALSGGVRNARHRSRARVGARQHRQLRRRPEPSHHLRPVRRRPQSRDADVHARSQRTISPRHHRERRRASPHAPKRTRSSDTELLLNELGLKPDQARELQNVPRGPAARRQRGRRSRKSTGREPGYTPNSPDGRWQSLPTHPWDPAAPALSAKIPLLIGWAHTEETLYDRPTPEKLALDEAGLRQRAAKRLEGDPDAVIAAFRQAYPDASPWDLYILIATDHPRGAYSRELARRKSVQSGAAPVYLYRFDWETPEGGGHMRSPHTIEIPFVFNNIKIAGPLISKMPEAYALAEKVSAVMGRLRAHRQPQYSQPAQVAGLFGEVTRHHAVQQPEPSGRRSRPPRAARHGARSKAVLAEY